MEDFLIRKNPYRAPGFSFGSRMETETSEDSRILGPGSYNIDYNTPKKNAISFSKSKRFEPLEKKAGPELIISEINSPTSLLLKNITDPMKTLGSSISFSKAPKTSIFTVSSLNLGPGQYSVKREFEGTSHSKKSSLKLLNEDPNINSDKLLKSNFLKDPPGPGQYDVFLNISAGHKGAIGFSMGSSKRHFIDPKIITKQGLNGIEYYKYSQFNHLGKGSPKLSFAKGNRKEISPTRNVPGPGTYESDMNKLQDKSKLKGTWGQAPRKIHGSLKELELGPGPGEYNLPIKLTRKGVKMSGAKRLEILAKEKSPGPGEYDILTEFERKKKNINKMTTLSKSRTLAKLATQISNEFDSPIRNSKLKFKVTEDDTKDLMNTSNSIKKSTKKGNMSSWIDFAIKSSISPGPKYLVQNQSIEKNIGNVGTRFSNFFNKDSVNNHKNLNSPGPGWYNDLYKEKDGSPISFATSKRKENPLLPEHTIGLPGPDHYDLILEKSRIGGTFTQASRHLETQEKESENEKKQPSPLIKRKISVV